MILCIFIWNLEGKQIHVLFIPQLYEGKIVYDTDDRQNETPATRIARNRIHYGELFADQQDLFRP